MRRRGLPALSRRALLATAGLAIVAAGGLFLSARNSEPPTVLDMAIDVSDTSARPHRSGKLGATTFDVVEGDQVVLAARLSRPAFAYLISYRPDGRHELCFPGDESVPPRATDHPRFPEADTRGVIGLDDGVGLQAFVVVVSREPLPPFAEWTARHGPAPWRAQVPADPGVVWRHDGDRIKTLRADGGDPGRGKGVAARSAWGAIADLLEWLQGRPGVDAVHAIAFGVQPAEH